MDNPPSAHYQTKRPTSDPSTPPKSGLPGWTNKSPAVTLPVPSLPRVPCIKAGFRRQTHRAHPVPLIHAHKNIPLNLGRAHTRFPSQITLLPYPQASTSSLDLARRIPLPSHLDGPCLFQPICLAQNLTIPPPTFPSIRQDGQPILVRSLRHCSLIKSPGPDRDYTAVLKDPSAISTLPSPTDSIPRVALPRLTSLCPLTGALSCPEPQVTGYPPRSSELHNSEHHHSSTSLSLLSPPRS